METLETPETLVLPHILLTYTKTTLYLILISTYIRILISAYVREKYMERASVFKNNQSQAIRLPKPVALPDTVKQVDIVTLGRSRLITPAGEVWDSWFDEEGTSDDFMNDREQPDNQERESL